jgi:hypothetical protein
MPPHIAAVVGSLDDRKYIADAHVPTTMEHSIKVVRHEVTPPSSWKLDPVVSYGYTAHSSKVQKEGEVFLCVCVRVCVAPSFGEVCVCVLCTNVCTHRVFFLNAPLLRHFAPHLSVLKKEEEPLNKKKNQVPTVRLNYDILPVIVQYSEKKKSFYNFITSLCGIVGGVFTTAVLFFY